MSACREGRTYSFPEAGTRCETVREAGFGGKENGELLSLAEGKFDVLITKVGANCRGRSALPIGAERSALPFARNKNANDGPPQS
jgi:hypothetical protein